MKSLLSLLVVIAISALGSAQTPIPSCATTCIDNAVASNTTCGETDLICQCQPTNLQEIVLGSEACVLNVCTDPIAVLNDAKADCSSILSSASASASTPSPTAAASTFAAATTLNGPTVPTDPSSGPTTTSGPTATDYGSIIRTNTSTLSYSSALNNATATKTSHIPQVSAGVGVKTGFDVAGAILAFGTGIFAAF